MKRYDRRLRVFAMALSALAGFVDAVGFVVTGGLFVSFMSGNSTRLAVGLAEGSGVVLLAGGLILSFLIGVIAGALLAPWKPARRKSLMLLLVTLLLVAAALAALAGFPQSGALLVAFAMGALNNVFLRDGEVSIGVTYMTGTLVRTGQRIAGAIRGDGPRDWLPYLLLWASLVAGAAGGAFIAAADAMTGMWVAAALTALVTVIAALLERDRSAPPPA